MNEEIRAMIEREKAEIENENKFSEIDFQQKSKSRPPGDMVPKELVKEGVNAAVIHKI